VRALIITADDFGFSPAVNEAVEEANVNGVLGTASLMVGAEEATDAAERALRLPNLKVGLHIVLTGSRPVSPPSAIPDLVGPDGRLSSRLFESGVRFFFRPGVRRQLEREIRAQFELFRETGLALDHANCHKHMHLHPTVADLVLKVGAEYGLKALRLPYEPARSWSVSCSAGKIASWLFLLPWVGLLRRKIREAGVQSNDFVFGLGDTGSMGLQKVLRFLDCLPPGVTEMYFHPAVRSCPELSRESGHSRHVLEFAALVDPTFRRALTAAKIRRISFCDLPLR